MSTTAFSTTAALLTEIAAGQGIPLQQARRLFVSNYQGKRCPGRDRCASPVTIWRWASRGVQGPEGERVRLESARGPSGRLTTAAAVARFLARLNAVDADRVPAPAAPRTPGQRRRASARAEQELEKAGI